ncbi:MAG: hypothetical protein J0H08_08690 [Rhizobiales bacterium]|nr:hypothetical protein [Hyphomicrobiales bacterium]
MAEVASAAMPRWRFVLGIASFFLAFAPHVVLGILILTGADARTVAAFAAVSFTLNKVFLLASVIFLGRPGFNRIKTGLVGALRDRLMPDEVGPWRYRIGLVMFTIPLVFAWKAPYVTDLMPLLGRHSTTAAIVTDAIFVLSLFVLGGRFWDKLRALFVRAATVAFPQR